MHKFVYLRTKIKKIQGKKEEKKEEKTGSDEFLYANQYKKRPRESFCRK